MRLDRRVDRRADGVERGILERPVGEAGRKAGGDQPDIPLAQRNVELLGETQDQRPAGRGAADLDEAEMPRGHVRAQRKLQLRQPAPAAPVAQMPAEAIVFPRHVVQLLDRSAVQ